jgi:hypothetical protein
MRFIALVVMTAAACSEDRFGTYLVVDGDSRIMFDHVDFFFGDYLPGRDVPTSPQHLQPVTGEQYLHTRIYDPLDSQKLAGIQSTFTYYLPASGDNLDLTQSNPTYVMVVASKGEAPVGIGELADFALTDNEVDQYIIHLEPFSPAAEIWGQGTPDCVRWERHRDMDPMGLPSTSAVVREHDKDCDGYLDAVDCNHLAYCDPSIPETNGGCVGRDACITDTTCSLGACTQIGPPGPGARQDCMAMTCLFDSVCSGACDPNASVDDRLACGLDQGSHMEVVIPLDDTQQLCQVPYLFTLPTNAGCGNPTIIYPLSGKEPDGFVLHAMPGTPDCTISIIPPSFGDPTFKNDEDVVLEIDAPTSGLMRTTFPFTIKGGPPDSATCGGPPIYMAMGPGVATCQ